MKYALAIIVLLVAFALMWMPVGAKRVKPSARPETNVVRHYYVTYIGNGAFLDGVDITITNPVPEVLSRQFRELIGNNRKLTNSAILSISSLD